MSLAANPVGRVPIAGDEPAASKSRPRHRTATARADIVSDPEAR